MNTTTLKYLTAVLIWLIPIISIAQTPLADTDRKQLDATFAWFSKNRFYGTDANFKARWERSKVLDKYGFQLSDTIWNAYRSAWIKDPPKVDELEQGNGILYYLRKAIDKTVADIRSTKVKKGAVIWKLYNMGYVVKTKDVCFGMDLNQPGAEKLVDVLDFVTVSHIHGDHNYTALLDAMIAAGKPVYTPFYKKGVMITSPQEYTHGEVKLRLTMNRQADVPCIVVQADLGSSARNYTIYHIGDSRTLEDLNPGRHINLFILHIENAIDVFNSVSRVKPDVTIYDHIMELGHHVNKWRWSYQYTYHKIKGLSPAKCVVLTWGERMEVGK
ncbi:MBL fold metallo-hydrolase [Mucilaginibacter myungsuensis]|uniref:MBL fold metallo-hydrolase n=1 Tax=Mucilaginibacter myungsuensis TaxID=649104 RepID=A0A929L2A8_9SPHI|nr:hypothetical protein [Mucilaginibacter myungsuensis]MBE9661921.1 hypothetical protein [Mucilaginibacter myungsuensis]MDN3599645.1 hypothetical protein [Mucilaginibacter myungsuensis]